VHQRVGPNRQRRQLSACDAVQCFMYIRPDYDTATLNHGREIAYHQCQLQVSSERVSFKAKEATIVRYTVSCQMHRRQL
jgi:hypothetical protein